MAERVRPRRHPDEMPPSRVRTRGGTFEPSSEAAPDRHPWPDEKASTAPTRRLVEGKQRSHEEAARGLELIAQGSLHDPRALVVVDRPATAEKRSPGREIEAVHVSRQE